MIIYILVPMHPSIFHPPFTSHQLPPLATHTYRWCALMNVRRPFLSVPINVGCGRDGVRTFKFYVVNVACGLSAGRHVDEG